MRVLMVNYEYPPIGGGAATATLHLGKSLVRAGHEICVLTSAYANQRGTTTEDGLCIHRVPSLRRLADRASIWEMAAFATSGLMALPGLVQRFRPERAIVMFTIPCGHIGLALHKVWRIPYVISLRGGDVPGHVPQLDRFHRTLAPLRRAVLSNATAVVANSDGLARLSMKTDHTPVEVVPNGVDCEFFKPAKNHAARAPTSRFTLLFVGRFSREKNIGDILSQLAALRRSGKSNAVLRIVGDGPMREALEHKARDLGLDDAVSWLGWVDRAKLREIYQSSDCLVNPSAYEGMPNVVLEAMASGLPVIASAVRGNAETVVDGETGYLFDPVRADDFGRALSRLFEQPDLAYAMGVRGREYAMQRFSWDFAATRYMGLFEQREAGLRRHAA